MILKSERIGEIRHFYRAKSHVCRGVLETSKKEEFRYQTVRILNLFLSLIISGKEKVEAARIAAEKGETAEEEATA